MKKVTFLVLVLVILVGQAWADPMEDFKAGCQFFHNPRIYKTDISTSEGMLAMVAFCKKVEEIFVVRYGNLRTAMQNMEYGVGVERSMSWISLCGKTEELLNQINTTEDARKLITLLSMPLWYANWSKTDNSGSFFRPILVRILVDTYGKEMISSPAIMKNDFVVDSFKELDMYKSGKWKIVRPPVYKKFYAALLRGDVQGALDVLRTVDTSILENDCREK